MNNYRDGLGFSTAQGSSAAMSPIQQQAGVSGGVSLSGNVGGGSGAQAGAIGLMVVAVGLVIFYMATRRIQGSR